MDVVGKGIDIAVRFGSTVDSTLRLRSLGPKRRMVCASPAYVERVGSPVIPPDLKDHNCLVMRFGATLDNVWHFGSAALKQIVTVQGNRVTNDGALARQWAIDGHGIVLKSELDVGPDIANRQLVELLADFAPPPVPLQMLFPPNRAQSRRVSALADHLAEVIHKVGFT